MKPIFDYSIIDAHCDTVTAFDREHYTLLNAPSHYSFGQELMYPRFLQVMDIWVDAAQHDVHGRIDEYTKEYYRQLEILRNAGKAQGFSVAEILTAKDLTDYFEYKAPYDGHAGAWLLGIEGGECVGDERDGLTRLHALFNSGVRLITLTWNTPNAISDTNCAAREKPGLTAYGREIVKEMNRLGIIIDLSHISDAGFWDTVELTSKPVIASHSDSRELQAHSRNLTDEMFKALVKNGGVTGINFCSAFLGGNDDIDRIVEHIEHFCALGGEKAIGMGSDFDGIGTLPGGIEGTRSLYKIFDRLLALNYTDAQVKGIAGENFLRVFRQILPEA